MSKNFKQSFKVANRSSYVNNDFNEKKNRNRNKILKVEIFDTRKERKNKKLHNELNEIKIF